MNNKNTELDKKILVNLFSDFILSKLPPNEITKIEVVDCESFLVVKGKTTHKSILDLNQVKSEFLEKYKKFMGGKNLINTIDLMEYGLELDKCDRIFNLFYNSSNPTFSICELQDNNSQNNQLLIKSTFPHGYSMNAGRDLYYYSKNIAYNLQIEYSWETISIELSRENCEETFKIFSDCQEEQNEYLKSAILDSFDFNFDKLRKEFESSDWVSCSLNPKEELEFVKKKNENLVLF